MITNFRFNLIGCNLKRNFSNKIYLFPLNSNRNFIPIFEFKDQFIKCKSRYYTSEVISKSKLLEYLSDGKMKREEKLLLDVRTFEEYSRGTIVDAKNLPLQRIEEALNMNREDRLNEFGFDILDWKNKEIVVFCQAGIRSRRAQIILEEKGFKLVENYEGSYSDWQSP